MKKTLVSALTTALVVGAASTTFAAANPFEDVPADHWAYDAVAQLAADGVIEGYGDGTYRGDQEITRYEMAQMIARAMAKNPNGADKALVDKLAAEFADELNNLGVRVAALEKKVDNVKWTGTVRYQYELRTNKRFRNMVGEKERDSAQRITLRLEPEMQINKNWTGHARLDYHTDMKTATNAPGNGNDESGFEIDRIWVQGDYDNLQIMLGKLPYVSIIDNGMLFDANVAGGQITAGNKVKATLTLGRANGEDADHAVFFEPFSTASYGGIEIYNDRDDKITWGVGYHRFANKERHRNLYGVNTSKEALNIWDIGLGWKITDTLALNGSYSWNTATNESALGVKDLKHAWSVELDYKGADPEDKGSWGAWVAYRKLGYEAVWAPTYDATKAGQKGWSIGFDYVPMKNFQATFKYFNGKDMIVNPNEKATRFFTELNFFF
ncbi:MAG: S-layer homology domain-containing protein [Selenomonadaceae bacterium]|nr:S-layer homology domain-containing protein [Selenomonadaceae bacterium]